MRNEEKSAMKTIQAFPGPVAVPARRRLLALAAAALPLASAGLLAPAAPAAAQTVHKHDHSFAGAKEWAKVLEDPRRDAWQKPHEVIQALALKPDAVVADIGAGTGYFATRLAHMLPKGRVLAVDTEPDMVKYLAERASRDGLKNLIAIRGQPADPRLPQKADLILLVNVYHHIDDRGRYFRRLRDSLQPGGRVAIIDFTMSSPEGPPKAARVEARQVQSELEKAGFVLAQSHDFLPNQFFSVFTAATR